MLGEFASAIQLRPVVQPEWLLEIRNEMQTKVHLHLTAKDHIAAVRLLHSVEKACQGKANEPHLQAESERTGRLLRDVLKDRPRGFRDRGA